MHFFWVFCRSLSESVTIVDSLEIRKITLHIMLSSSFMRRWHAKQTKATVGTPSGQFIQRRKSQSRSNQFVAPSHPPNHAPSYAKIYILPIAYLFFSKNYSHALKNGWKSVFREQFSLGDFVHFISIFSPFYIHFESILNLF